MNYKYERISEKDVPTNILFQPDEYTRGHIVQTFWGAFKRTDLDRGAPYKKIVDRSEGPDAAEYFKRVENR